jgi:hypothetical protein
LPGWELSRAVLRTGFRLYATGHGLDRIVGVVRHDR